MRTLEARLEIEYYHQWRRRRTWLNTGAFCQKLSEYIIILVETILTKGELYFLLALDTLLQQSPRRCLTEEKVSWTITVENIL
jgi:hypothetical protein